MHKHTFPQKLFVLLVLLPAILACSLTSQAQPVEAPPPVAPTQILNTEIPQKQAPQPAPTTAAGEAPGAIRQWAAEAEASSEYGSDDWSARQATGAPNTSVCSDLATAWASAQSDGRDWINLYYAQPVIPSEIRIVQTYYPDQVVQVDLIDMQGKLVTVYTAKPRLVENPCPYTLSIPVNQGDLVVQGVRVTVDQSVLLYWNEIDAVELVGVPGVGTPVRPTLSNP